MRVLYNKYEVAVKIVKKTHKYLITRTQVLELGPRDGSLLWSGLNWFVLVWSGLVWSALTMN